MYQESNGRQLGITQFKRNCYEASIIKKAQVGFWKKQQRNESEDIKNLVLSLFIPRSLSQ